MPGSQSSSAADLGQMIAVRDRVRRIRAKLDRGEDVRAELPDVLSEVEARFEASNHDLEELRSYCDRLLLHQSQLDRRLIQIETNRLFTAWNTAVTRAVQLYRRLDHALLRSPLYPLIAKLDRRTEADQAAYTQWMNQEEARVLPADERRDISAAWCFRPVISIILPVHQPSIEWLAEAIRSVEAQCYREWQLCIAFDGARQDIAAALKGIRYPDRTRIAKLGEVSGLNACRTAAAQLATGDFLAFFDQSDVLAPYALHEIAAELQRGRAGLLYSDEDRLDEKGLRVQPTFKPDWSEELLYGTMYTGHLVVAARDLFERVGGFCPAAGAANDYDLVLRMASQEPAIRHIGKVLYHSRLPERGPKIVTDEAARKAVESAVQRKEGGAVHVTAGRAYVVERPHLDQTLLSVIICSRSPRLVKHCIGSLRATAGAKCRFVVVHHVNQGPDASMGKMLAHLDCTVIPYTGTFNFAAMNNTAAAQVGTPYLLFLNDDVFAAGNRGWNSVLAQLRRPEVGVAGAVLRYTSGAIQHAGIVLGLADGAGHAGRFQFQSDLWPWLTLTRNVSAVTGACLGIRSEVFHELGGFDPSFPNNYNDVDLCLRARALGYEVICAGGDDLFHKECQTRRGVTLLKERDLFYRRWHHVLNRPDPYYSASFAHTETIALNL